MKKIKVIQIGCGKMSKYTMKYAIEKGCVVVGAFDVSTNIIGKDISEIIEGENKNIIVENIDNLETRLKELKPDIAIVTTMSLLSDVHDILRILAKNGINAITTCEEAFYASNSNPKMYKELDILAKSNNCTILGTGFQDVFWGNLISLIAGSTQRIKKIVGSSSYNVEDYGIALANAHGAGLTLKEFEKNIASVDKISENDRQKLIDDGKFLPSYMWNVVGWLAERLNLEITSIKQECIPTTNDEEIHSTTLNMNIKKGDATGMSALVTAETKEGITIEAECIGKVYNSEEFDVNKWTIVGEPNTEVIVNKPDTVLLTCADIVSRIPDVINAHPGFISTSELDVPRFKMKF